ncbi:single-stranded DNA-binding protein [Companilactobacillus sp. RD055328]|uniref:single-stranded DNA-binding protein n=1 Tax=Companilactobacillus sp. RD055328 TaxID=2916634 RepID=UPI001FC84CC6|nr:single-stranded DNA-binding protein [Companilactobacillus sp. RD055328]GKQ43402.1 single-stranded DNA-binding protein [Companilactobacillus sp. RD055328]
MINRTILVGRLTRDPELRYTASGAAVGSFTIAVNRQFTNAQGEREADFINCVIWRKAAENFANFTKKGSLVGIDGRLQSRSYDNQQGQRVYVTEVVVDNFSLLESRSTSENRTSSAPSAPANNTNNSFNNNNGQTTPTSKPENSFEQKTDPFADNSQPIDISDDDLPF